MNFVQDWNYHLKIQSKLLFVSVFKVSVWIGVYAWFVFQERRVNGWIPAFAGMTIISVWHHFGMTNSMEYRGRIRMRNLNCFLRIF